MLLNLVSTYEGEEVIPIPAPIVLFDEGGGLGAEDLPKRSRILFRIIDELEVDLFGTDEEETPRPRRRRRRFREIEEDGRETIREEIDVPVDLNDEEDLELAWSLDGAARWALVLGVSAAVLAGPLMAAYAAGATIGGSLAVATARARLGAFLRARAARRLPGPRELE